MSGQDEEEDVMVPGFSYGSGPSGGGVGNGLGIGGGAGSRWWGRDEDAMGSQSQSGGAGAGGESGMVLPGGLSDGFEYRGTPFGGDDAMNADDFIPGLGAVDHVGNTSVVPRQSGPLPPQEDMWSGGGSGGRNEDWGSGGGGGGRNEEWGNGGGRRGGGSGYYERRGGPRRGRY